MCIRYGALFRKASCNFPKSENDSKRLSTYLIITKYNLQIINQNIFVENLQRIRVLSKNVLCLSKSTSGF